MLDFAGFAARFTAFFNEEGIALTRETNLYDELALDSFDAFRLIIFLEDLADVLYPDDRIPPIFTVGDAYDYYCTLTHASETR